MTTCTHCNGTGDMTGQGHLDCTRCEAATERAKFNEWANRAGIPATDDTWAIFQNGKATAASEKSMVPA